MKYSTSVIGIKTRSSLPLSLNNCPTSFTCHPPPPPPPPPPHPTSRGAGIFTAGPSRPSHSFARTLTPAAGAWSGVTSRRWRQAGEDEPPLALSSSHSPLPSTRCLSLSFSPSLCLSLYSGTHTFQGHPDEPSRAPDSQIICQEAIATCLAQPGDGGLIANRPSSAPHLLSFSLPRSLPLSLSLSLSPSFFLYLSLKHLFSPIVSSLCLSHAHSLFFFHLFCSLSFSRSLSLFSPLFHCHTLSHSWI